jgi:hypothetical protein
MSPRFSIAVVALGSLVVGCGGADGSVSDTASQVTAATVAVSVVAETTVSEPTGSDVPVDTSTTTTTAVVGGIVNVWVGPAIDLTALPLGDAHVSTESPSVGGLFACGAGNPNGGGADVAGPWIDEEAGTWDATGKIAVNGSIEWPMATYSEIVDGEARSIASGGLPVGHVTGVFPIAATDPAFAYDRNPNTISENDVAYELPVTPVVSDEPGCLSGGAVAIMRNGVVAFAPLDERHRDAVAYETQDVCDGHPQQIGIYHYHDVPSCLLEASVGPSTVVGFALDGFPIVVERDVAGELPTNADLDECHGRTSAVLLDGEVVETYHYSATREFPYFIGCYRGTPVS